MESDRGSEIGSHYGRGRVLESILDGLRASGKDLARLEPADLAPVDAFHVRGREATIELADRASLGPGMRVLDAGSGLGGSARFLAAQYGCRVSGVDLTREFVEVADRLTAMVRLQDRVDFRVGSVLEVPFADGSFNVVWTEHVQMNIADKRGFYRELARVLAPGGQLLFHDIFQGANRPLHFPVPWAEEPSISFLATPEEVRGFLSEAGFTAVEWADRTRQSLEWVLASVERGRQAGPSPLGPHLLMGETAKTKLGNAIRNLQEERMVVAQAVAGR